MIWAAIGFTVVVGGFIILLCWKPKEFRVARDEARKSYKEFCDQINARELKQFSSQAQRGKSVRHNPENVTYLDSARVSKELRDALARQRKK